ncbi:MAG: ATP-binding protein [Prevotella sp.]|nr:ATP-binding protein [Prevotella sp.]
MDLIYKTDYTEEDLRELISTQAEESVHLDFKSAGAFDKKDDKRAEIAKDVSAFANSDGGIIVYGMNEENHVAHSLSYIDGNVYTKEWVERVINNGIQRRIEGIKIYPIRVDGDVRKSVYVVSIPRSANAPHMCSKRHIYYKRYNFESVPMEEYEVRDLFNRAAIPNLVITGCALIQTKESEDDMTYDLWANIANDGNQVCESFKLNFYINNPLFCDITYKVLEEKHSHTIISQNRLKLSTPSREPIYPGEELNMGTFEIKVKRENNEKFLKDLIIDMILFYPGGNYDLAYIPFTREFIDKREDINKLLEKRKNND